jgi:hypothetical protein
MDRSDVTVDDEPEDEWLRSQLVARDEVRGAARLRRQRTSGVHPLIPSHWFAPASSECREMYVDGHFYGCISLSQSVGEGLSKFLAEHHNVPPHGQHRQRVARLLAARAVSPVAADAFRRIEGKDRNHIHHLNKEVPRDAAVLEARAAECVQDLLAIEAEVFAFTPDVGGAIRPLRPQYWAVDGKLGPVFIRLT